MRNVIAVTRGEMLHLHNPLKVTWRMRMTSEDVATGQIGPILDLEFWMILGK